jgi:uncharacterized protein YydD (DUF2326 family)
LGGKKQNIHHVHKIKKTIKENRSPLFGEEIETLKKDLLNFSEYIVNTFPYIIKVV